MLSLYRDEENHRIVTSSHQIRNYQNQLLIFTTAAAKGPMNFLKTVVYYCPPFFISSHPFIFIYQKFFV